MGRNWLHGRRYEASEARERYARSSSLARESNSKGFEPSALRMARAASEVATSATASQAQAASATASKAQLVASSMSASKQQASSQQTSVRSSRVEETSVQKKSSLASQKQEIRKSTAVATAASKASASSAASAASSKRVTTESSRRIDDDISKKIADIHITPFSKGQEADAASAASARARARILELERELEEITKKAMTTQVRALKTAKQMAAEAMADEANMSSSVKKTKKVMIESSAKIN